MVIVYSRSDKQTFAQVILPSEAVVVVSRIIKSRRGDLLLTTNKRKQIKMCGLVRFFNNERQQKEKRKETQMKNVFIERRERDMLRDAVRAKRKDTVQLALCFSSHICHEVRICGGHAALVTRNLQCRLRLGFQAQRKKPRFGLRFRLTHSFP